MGKPRSTTVILTIGHSNRPMDDFLALLKKHNVARIVDIRTIPKSRRNPQFNQAELRGALRGAGVGYMHLKKLGGLRHTRKDSTNLGWRNASFRGFADYMQSAEFEEGLARLLKLAAVRRSAMMCAEAVPWRCHRSLVADALVARGFAVGHILSAGLPRRHAITRFARVRRGQVSYPDEKPRRRERPGTVAANGGSRMPRLGIK